MTDREALIQAIRKSPTDNTVRLVLADWLMEFGEGDQDAATAEFIRVSLNPESVNGEGMLGFWLSHNWRRLIPRTLDLHIDGPDAGYQVYGTVVGSEVRARIRLAGFSHAVTCHFTFSRGFVVRAYGLNLLIKLIRPTLKSEQPLVKCVGRQQRTWRSQ
jgi:uncharacterized protein (TIGR02996 family)